MTYENARIDMQALALEAIHHGAGVSGNTTRLRAQDTVLEDGTIARVPFVSANSWAHQLRVSGVRWALRAMGMDHDGSLGTEAVVHLLFSGGALSKGGSSVRLDTARKLERLFPILSLMGYSAGNTMTTGKMQISHWTLICRENKRGLPAWVDAGAHAELPAGELRTEAFLTRHDVLSGSSESKYLPTAVRAAIEASISGTKDDKRPTKRADSTQMIADTEVIMRGAKLWCSMWLHNVTRIEIAALRTAMEEACLGRCEAGMQFRIGGKTNRGYGLIAAEIHGSQRMSVRSPEYSDSEALANIGEAGANADYAEYLSQLQENRDEIMELLQQVGA